MNPGAITAETVKAALRAVRAARPLDASPLLGSPVLARRLGELGIDDSRSARAGELPRWLAEVVSERLVDLRSERAPLHHGAMNEIASFERLQADFRAGSEELEAFGILWFRFFAGRSVDMGELPARLGVSGRTLRRRLDQAYGLLADMLRELERKSAARQVHGYGIPRPLTRFVGRESEIGEVRSLLAEHRLVTLTGPAGVGKSRLGIRLAEDLAPDFPGGAWYVELADLVGDSQLESAFMSALGLRAVEGRSSRDVLVGHLAKKRALVVVDNCEHMIGACSRLLETLLPHCPFVQVLATSRTRLRVSGAASYAVPTMKVPSVTGDIPALLQQITHFDATRLFADRAAAVRPEFAITAGNAARVARVCDGLEGLPLSVELATARLRYLSLEELEASLTDRFALLRDGRSRSRRGHESLRATLDWSFGLLTPAEQALLLRLSVFRGGWSSSAAASVCTGSGVETAAVLLLLAELEARSMIRVSQGLRGVRYSMLESVREYALSRLEEGDRADDWRYRHADHLVQLAEAWLQPLWEPAHSELIDSLEAELGNATAAMSWELQRGRFVPAARIARCWARLWSERGRALEGLDWLVPCLDRADSTWPPSLHADVLYAAAELGVQMGDMDTALARLDQARAIFESTGRACDVAACDLGMGNVHLRQGRNDLARQHFEEARRASDTLAPSVSAASLVGLATVDVLHGVGAAAIDLMVPAEAWYRDNGDDRGLALLRQRRGVLLIKAARLPEARSDLEAALAYFRHASDTWRAAICLDNLGTLALAQLDVAAAELFFRETLAAVETMGDRRGVAHALGGLGDVADIRGRSDEARQFWTEAMAIARAEGQTHLLIMLITSIVDSALRDRNLEIARVHLDEGEHLAAEAGYKALLVKLRLRRAALALYEGDPETARRVVHECLDHCLEVNSKVCIARTLERLAEIEHVAGEAEPAFVLLQAAGNLRVETGVPLNPHRQADLDAIGSDLVSVLGESRARDLAEMAREITLDHIVDLARKRTQRGALGKGLDVIPTL